MLFIVTEILRYIFAILFPPPNKNLLQITIPFHTGLSPNSASLLRPDFAFSLSCVAGSFCTGTELSDLAHLLHGAAGPMHSHPPSAEGSTLPVLRVWDKKTKGLGLGCWGQHLELMSKCWQLHVGASWDQCPKLNHQVPEGLRGTWGPKLGEEIEGEKGEDIEVSSGEERSLEEFLSRGTDAHWCFSCHLCALLPGSTKFN